MSSKVHDQAIDTLRLMAILAVVMIHTTTRTLEISHYDLIHGQFTLFLNQAARFAVPLFFLISGYVLELSHLSYLGYLSYLKKRIGKIAVPYVLWSTVYYFFIYTKHTDNFLTALLTGSSSYQLYFIPSLFIFYLIFPILSRGFQRINARDSSTVVGMTLGFVLLIIQIWILNDVYKNFGFPLPYPIAVVVFNFFVFILGMVFAQSRDKVKQITQKVWPLLLLGAGALAYFIFGEGFNNYYKTWNFEAFYTQWRPSILIYTILVFGGLYGLVSKINSKYINTLASLSFSVFFIHVLIIELVWRYVYTYDIIFFIIVISLSLAASQLQKLMIEFAKDLLARG